MWTILTKLSSYQLRGMSLHLCTGNETNFVFLINFDPFLSSNNTVAGQSRSEVTKIALGTNPYNIIVTPEVIAVVKLFLNLHKIVHSLNRGTIKQLCTRMENKSPSN